MNDGPMLNENLNKNKSLTVNLFPLPGLILQPGGKTTLNLFEERYLNLLKSCEGQDIYLALGHADSCRERQCEVEIPHEKFKYLYPEVGYGKVQVLGDTAKGTKVIVVQGIGKGLVEGSSITEDGFIQAIIDPLEVNDELDESKTFLYRRLKNLTRERLQELLKNDREVNILMDNLNGPCELVSFYTDHIVREFEHKFQIFKLNDINDKIEFLGQLLTRN